MPVVTFVWPSGSQAASAGTFLLAAGNVAAMAPSTNVGAATPVSMTGEDLPETIANKATQDAASFLRSIAINRDRNVKAYEATVTKAKAYSEIEAIEALMLSETDKINGRLINPNPPIHNSSKRKTPNKCR